LWSLIIAAGALAYHNSLGGPFIFDDREGVVTNESIRKVWPVPIAAARNTPTAGRPVTNFTLAINYCIGGLDVHGYHVFNLLIHIVNGLLLFAILRRTLSRALGAPGAVPVAACIVLLWIVHPLLTETVSYIINRTELLCSMFLLLSLLCAIRGFGLPSPERRPWFALAMLANALGMGCKESMAIAPLIVLLYDYVFISGSWAQVWRRHKSLHLGMMAGWIVLGALLSTNPHPASVGFGHERMTPWQYLLIQTGLIWRYLRLCVWPSDLIMDYDQWPAPPLGLALLAGGLLLAVFVVSCGLARRRHPLGFVGVSFFLLLGPSSSFVPLVTEVGAERRMYLPLALVMIVLGAGVYRLARLVMGRVSVRPRWAAAAAGVAVAGALTLLGLRTLARNELYQSPLALWMDSATNWSCSRGDRWIADMLVLENRIAQAEDWLRRSLQKHPREPQTHATLALLLVPQRRLDEAERHLRRAIELAPNEIATAYNDLGALLAERSDFAGAEHNYRMAVRIDPKNPLFQNNLAQAMIRLGRLRDAVPYYRRGLELEPKDAEMRNKLGCLLLALGEPRAAAVEFELALRDDPESEPIRRNLEWAIAARDGRATSRPSP
jgi:Flp pilus assembly protein TadD